ncbi:MAG: hypothetical protein ACKV22_20190 [Bryobacteraceae bacterium]
MQPTDAVTRAQSRIENYWHADGLVDLVGGAVFLLLAARTYFTIPPEGAGGNRLLDFSLFVAFLTLLGFHRRIVDFVKGRLVYPRTGYVAPPPEVKFDSPVDVLSVTGEGWMAQQQPRSRRPSWREIAGGIVASLASVMIITQGRWAPALAGGLAAALIFVLATLDQRNHYRFTLLLIAAVSMAVSILNVEDRARPAATFGGIGLALIVGGAVKLVRYLTTHRIQGRSA